MQTAWGWKWGVNGVLNDTSGELGNASSNATSNRERQHWGEVMEVSGNLELVNPYPGSKLKAQEVLHLADQFRCTAAYLAKMGSARDPRKSAPFRLITIHAVELYLNAYLLEIGVEPQTIRGLQHDLTKHLDLVTAAGMVLRKRTVKHLRKISANREYLISRYDVPDVKVISAVTELTATVEDIRGRVVAKLVPAQPPQQPKPKRTAHRTASPKPAKKIKTVERPGPASIALRA